MADAVTDYGAISGIEIMAIDTDPAENVALTIGNMSQPNSGMEIVAVIPRTFSNGRQGWLVVWYDASKDPRAKHRHART